MFGWLVDLISGSVHVFAVVVFVVVVVVVVAAAAVVVVVVVVVGVFVCWLAA